MEKRLSILFGLLIGGMWMGEVLLGNLGGTSVLGISAPHTRASMPWPSGSHSGRSA
ncbi:hypothetical protein SBA3_2070003 [Candidatus Sulfopaludibacter sp. SbA3]|nr:hypothetical protein SBA3_2070003 [Candidatus Sulfopaludibacter sp. SbA3]